MSTRIETVPAGPIYTTVHRIERGEEVVEGDVDSEVASEVAVALSYDEVVTIEGTEEEVNAIAAQMLATVPGGPHLAIRRDALEDVARSIRDGDRGRALDILGIYLDD